MTLIRSGAVALLLCAACGTPATATQIAGCTTQAQVSASVGREDLRFVDDLGLHLKGHPGPTASTDAALVFACGDLFLQLDAAFEGHWSSRFDNVQTVHMSNPQGHIGGAAFWADDRMRVGVAGSYILKTVDFSTAPLIDGDAWRGGAFAEWHASDQFTLRSNIFGFSSTIGDGQIELYEYGLEAGFNAQYYPADNWRVAARVDTQLAKLSSNGPIFVVEPETWRGYAASLEVEYLIPDTALSLAVGGRYARRQIGPAGTSTAWEALTDRQIFLTARYAFGGDTPSSLRQRDRNGPFDNTSVFQERLPSFNYDLGQL